MWELVQTINEGLVIFFGIVVCLLFLWWVLTHNDQNGSGLT